MTTSRDIAEALRLLPLDAVAASTRTLLGIAGPPGSGKSTFAARLAEQANREAGRTTPHAPFAAVLPMDGFHLPARELERQNFVHRKGAPHTFDAPAFIDLLAKVRSGAGVWAPRYDRQLHDVVPDAVKLAHDTPLIIVEGNYLLLEDEPWRQVKWHLHEVWYLDVPLPTCLERIRLRHIAGGCTPAEAARKLAHNDRPNAEHVTQSRHRADRILQPPPKPD